ncbi:hypothetical protein [Pseudorhodoferax sp.]|uniref:hypothetical protein n=1 Tax=Pseudorhodoferax sp. TaxID=1993553 RepID=UPI0039E32D2B
MLALLGCSPALNWRALRLDAMFPQGAVPAGPLRLTLPCKPDRAERTVPMGGQDLTLQMLGCEADGATFAVSHVLAPAPEALLAGWKAAVLAHLQAQDVQERAWAPAGAMAVPPALQLQARGRRGGGTPLAVHAAWLAARDGAGVHLYHAVVLAPQARPELAETFFAGMAAAP